MSTPKNPLDIFSSYTYHFELHAAPTWDGLKHLASSDANAQSPSPRNAFDYAASSMLINTRRDAYQSIDNVKFGYIGPSTNPNGHYIPDATMSFTVYEPNRIAFIEKLYNLMRDYEVSNLTNLMWVLKIIFVGQTPNNTFEKLPSDSEGLIIPMMFANMDSSFNEQGGVYNMHFVSVATFGGAGGRDSLDNIISLGRFNTQLVTQAPVEKQPDQPATYVDYQHMTVLTSKTSTKTDTTKTAATPDPQYKPLLVREMTTVNDTCLNFFVVLNDNYDKIYKTMLLNDIGAKVIKYKINIDPELSVYKLDHHEPSAGTVTGQMSFAPNKSITSCIYTILRSSKDLNMLMADSISGIRVDGHPNVNFVSVIPRVIYFDTYIEVNYDVTLYKGSNPGSRGIVENEISFDYMFASPGKNVDVLHFDIHMNSALAWFGNSSRGGTDFNTTDLKNLNKVIGVNAPVSTSNDAIGNRPRIPVKSKDIALLNYIVPENRGSVTLNADTVESQQLMFNSVVQMHGAFESAFTFTIRGNLDLLRAGAILPDLDMTDVKNNAKIPFGIKAPLWLKVNIKDPQGIDFFYKGRYNVISVENHFIGGKFTQDLAVMMMDDSVLSSSIGNSQGNSQVNNHTLGMDKTPTSTLAMFAKLEAKYPYLGAHPGLLKGVYAAESSSGTNKRVSSAGAQGPFQFMGPTAKQYGLTNPNDLTASADAAAHYYNDLLKKYNGDVPKALAGYNWGPGNVDKLGIANAPLETRNYIVKVQSGM